MSEVFNADVLDAINRALSAENVVTREGDEPVYCNVNNETREIEIPGEITIFGVEHDENAVRVFFKCPKIIGDNVDIDITKSMVYIIYINAGGEKDQYIVTDVNETEDGDVTFSWLINRKPAKYQGITQFGIRVIKSKTGGEIENEWNTTVANANILNGVETEDIELSGDNIDVVNQLLDLTKQEIELTKQNLIEEIEQKGQETLETIPSDYTTAAQNALSAKNEVEDIRVGADGKIYDSAGEAVRGQVGSLSEDIDNQWLSNEMIKYITNYMKMLNLYDPKYAEPNKDIVTTDTPTFEIVESDSNCISGYIPVKAGKKIYTSVNGSYCLFDRSKKWDGNLRKGISSTNFALPESDGFILISFQNVNIEKMIVYTENMVKTDEVNSIEIPNLIVDTKNLRGNLEMSNNIFQTLINYTDFFNSTYNIDVDKSKYPYTATIDTDYQYPFISTGYNIDYTNGEKLWVYFDFDTYEDFSNITEATFQYGISNNFLFYPVKIEKKVKILVPLQYSKDYTDKKFAFGFRNMKGNPDGENYKLKITINSIQILRLNELLDELKTESIIDLFYKYGFDDGNLNLKSPYIVSNSIYSYLSKESKYVRTGWFGKKICTFGDSTIAQERWQPYMAKRLGCTYTNRGIGGSPIEGTGSTAYSHDDRIATIDSDADAIVIFGGFNDISIFKDAPIDGKTPINSDSEWNYDPSNMQGAISLMVKKIRQKIPKAKIIMACPPYGWQEPIRPNLISIKNAIKNACEYLCIDFIDMYSLCQWNWQNTTEYHPEGDYIHFNGEDGAKIIASIVCNALMKYEPF